MDSGQLIFLIVSTAISATMLITIILMIVAVVLCQVKDSKFIKQQQMLLQNQIPQQPSVQMIPPQPLSQQQQSPQQIPPQQLP